MGDQKHLGDKCPQCGEYRMPFIRENEHPTARACQNCFYIEELPKETV